MLEIHALDMNLHQKPKQTLLKRDTTYFNILDPSSSYFILMLKQNLKSFTSYLIILITHKFPVFLFLLPTLRAPCAPCPTCLELRDETGARGTVRGDRAGAFPSDGEGSHRLRTRCARDRRAGLRVHLRCVTETICAFR